MQQHEQAAMLLKQADANLIRTARATSPDKLEWQPLDRGRPILNLVQECAQTPALLARTLEEQSTDWYTEQVSAEGERERHTLTNLDACQALMQRNTDRLIAAIQALPDSAQTKEVTLPFGMGGDITLGDLVFGNYWNTTYHQGQVAYIQTLYGDTTNH